MSRLEGFTFGYIPDDLLFSRAPDKAKLIYGALTRYLDQDRKAWPSEATIAKRLGCSERTVRREIAWLIESGWITKAMRRTDHGVWDSNVYTLNTKPIRRGRFLRRPRATTARAANRDHRTPVAAGSDQQERAATGDRRPQMAAGSDQGIDKSDRRPNLAANREKTRATSDASRLVDAPHPRGKPSLVERARSLLEQESSWPSWLNGDQLRTELQRLEDGDPSAKTWIRMEVENIEGHLDNSSPG